MAALLLLKRQGLGSYDDSDCDNDTDMGGCDDSGTSGTSWWYSSTGLTVRYAVAAVIFILIVGFLAIAHHHARVRISRGLEPLAYHRWLVRRRYPNRPMYRSDPQYAPYPPQNGPAYGMNHFQPPPPAYNHFDAPPTYQPPEGASKPMPDQNVETIGTYPNRRSGEPSASGAYEAPLHPPPAHTQ